jgi:carbon storage regulator
MLVLTRKAGEEIIIDGDIRIKVSQVQGNRVKLCIEAPKSHRIVRSEIADGMEPVASTCFNKHVDTDSRVPVQSAK